MDKFVQIAAKDDCLAHVYSELEKLSGVITVYTAYGKYNILVQVRPGLNKILDDIKEISGVYPRFVKYL